MIRVKYLGFLPGVTGRAEEEVDAEEATVREIVDPRVLEATGGDLVVLVNGLPSSLDARVRDGDTVALLPHIGGG